jgi:hypothetical protein
VLLEYVAVVGRDSVGGIATCYELDSPALEPRWSKEYFSSPYRLRPVVGPTQPSLQWVPRLFPWVKQLGRAVDHPPHLAPRLRTSSVIPLLTLCAFVARDGDTFAFLRSSHYFYFGILVSKHSCSVDTFPLSYVTMGQFFSHYFEFLLSVSFPLILYSFITDCNNLIN